MTKATEFIIFFFASLLFIPDCTKAKARRFDSLRTRSFFFFMFLLQLRINCWGERTLCTLRAYQIDFNYLHFVKYALVNAVMNPWFHKVLVNYRVANNFWPVE
jgi:hypothetical protein